MKVRVIDTEIEIYKKGEQNFFQVSLPSDVCRIIGIESAARVLTDMGAVPYTPGGSIETDRFLQFHRSKLVGTLKFQCPGQRGWFLAAQVMDEDANAGITDLYAPDYIIEDPVRRVYWKSRTWTHTVNNEPSDISIGSQGYLYGCFTDHLGKAEGRDIHYIVSVYAWCEIK